MPLHGIPLCDFKYAGEIYSGATFKYDTAGTISKVKLKLLSKSSKEISLDSEKLLSKFINPNIFKNNKKSLLRESCEIGKDNLTKELKAGVKEENKLYKTCLLKIEDSYFIKNSTIRLRRENSFMNMKSGISLDVMKNNGLNLKPSRSLKNESNRKLGIEISRTLGNTEFNGLSIEKSKELSNEGNKNLIIEIGRQMLRIWDNGFNKDKAFSLTAVDRENVLLSKLNNVFLSRDICVFNKHDIVKLARNKVKNICKPVERYIVRNDLKQICFDLSKRLYRKYNLKEMFKDNYRLINKIAFKGADKISFQFTLRKNPSKNINKSFNINYLRKLNLKNISKVRETKLVYKWSNKNISKVGIYGLNKTALKNIFKSNYRLFRKIINKNICYGNEAVDLVRFRSSNINKYDNKFLDFIKVIDIYKQLEKGLIDLATTDISQIQSYYLKNNFNREIYKEFKNNKFINVIKRWWWLNATDPRDSLIVPNKDFDYDSSLLNNPGYEYLRFNNHPISWGNDWGIDFNIPAYRVSIEIMLDLVNILIMIWHDSVQAWMCCSGKESMQFIMELLYDWYTLDISKSNTDYCRAYRWIRWEIEKVYFLNLDTGLQAVGVLISNLIDYLKQHHFNIVPIWKNPKAMDIERNFNRIAQNGDLMKSLNKAKGKRYYYIETQNIEKKNIFGR
ncbi:hypothetical protein [Clostridium sp. JN-1]|uniref:hypothetical protein n=1 Tax=Clostridium sp. JN-1 TaxID=2483110 RepID=UPI000F0BA57A|nr:hypothetical protein [Clostridium sp. JN-1]